MSDSFTFGLIKSNVHENHRISEVLDTGTYNTHVLHVGDSNGALDADIFEVRATLYNFRNRPSINWCPRQERVSQLTLADITLIYPYNAPQFP